MADADEPNSIREPHHHEAEAHLMGTLLFLTSNITTTTHGIIDYTGLAHAVYGNSRTALYSNLEILLVVLLEAFCTVNKRIFRDWDMGSGLGPEEVCLSTRRLMKSATWCPSELNLINLTFDYSSYHFTSRLVGPSAEARHPLCTATKCLAFQLEEYSYQTAHTATHKGCREVVVLPEELQVIFETGTENFNPLVLITISDRNEVQLHVVDDGPYVAISHVWSDGPGHPPGVKSLPECQLRYLTSLVQQTGLRESIVWMESLCVPANAGPARQKDLAQMASVYRGASHVLVLDSDLLSIPSTCCNEELLKRIALSRWMRRVWTLEGGVLARSRLLFQFLDRSIRLSEPGRPSTDSIALNCMFLISQYLPVEQSVISIITALYFRTTSWIADEPLCIRYIMNVATSPILSIHWVHHDLRMLELLPSIGGEEPCFPLAISLYRRREIEYRSI